MKIAFVLSDFTSAGGIERVTSTLSDTFVKNGHKVTIISFFRTNKNSIYESSHEVKIEYLTNKSYLTKKIAGFSRLVMYLKIFRNLKSFFKENKYDYVIGQGFPVNFSLWLIGLKKNLIACEHTHYNYYNSLLKTLRLIVYKDLITIVLTEKDKIEFSKSLSNVYLIPNPTLFANNQILSDLTSTKIISVGRLEYEKGYDLLLHALKDVFNQHPEWSIDIYGNGVLRTYLIELCDKMKLNNNVFFKGVTNNIKEKYINASLFILSSRFEGFGMVLVEAASCGLPIISFDCPTGPNDILKDNGGILVESGNVKALTDAILKMINDKELRIKYSQKGPGIAKRYSTDKIYEYWNDLFTKLNTIR